VGGFTLEDAARRAGHHRWAELRLFELLGAWVPAVPEPEVKIRVHTEARRHAWHAELWAERLPAIAPDAVERLTVPADDGVRALVEVLARADGGTTIERLVGVYRVLLPYLVATYRSHLEAAPAVSEGPAIRALTLVLHDEEEDRRRGELLLQSLLRTGEDVERAAVQQDRLGSVLASAGGGTTLTPPVW
jgi:hypothetical protein